MGRAHGWDAPVQTRRIGSRQVTEIHLRVRPADPASGFAAQARSMYRGLMDELRAQQIGPADIVTEKVFLSDIAAQAHDLLRTRDESLPGQRGNGGPAPALTLVQQPPARAGQMCELQAYALVSAQGASLASRNLQKRPRGCSGRVLEAGGARHLFLSNVTGGVPGDDMTFPRQAAAMFLSSEETLEREGLSFRDVVRTWIYLKEIDSQYSDLNACRREFFTSQGVRPAPASTGILGAVHPADRACGLDLRAISNDGRVRVRPIHAPTMNEAPVYGSDFSRGTSVAFEDRTVLYISGTASIDTSGNVIALGDIEGQVDRMLANVKALLDGQGAGWADLASAVTYLKLPEYREAFIRVAGRHGLPDRIANTLCVADICRPEWLCEMEAIAVLV